MEAFPPGSPFSAYSIASHDPLRAMTERHVCAQCKKSVRYFCYYCICTGAASPSTDALPSVSLPVERLLVVKDVRELQGKSTAVHAKLLAPSQVDMLAYDAGDEAVLGALEASLGEAEECAILFPDETAQEASAVDWQRIRRLVVLDGTWQQAKGMARSPVLARITNRVKLDEANRTLFWRYQQMGPHCLSTIEAIYHLMVAIGAPAAGARQLDNLLYYFSFFYHLIQDEYRRPAGAEGAAKRPFTSRHSGGYIRQ